MTRETVEFLGWLVFGCGAIALLLKCGLFFLAGLDWWATRSLTRDDPERLVGEQEILGMTGRVVAVALIALVGLVWVTTINRDSNLPPVISLSPIAMAIVVVLIGQSVLSVLQGILGLIYRRRLLRKMREVRTVCDQTTFVDCPFLSNEGRERLRGKVQEVHMPVPGGDVHIAVVSHETESAQEEPSHDTH
jgi:hypothetical protein